MAKTSFHGKKLKSNLNPPAVGTKAPNFKLVRSDLSEASMKDYKGKKIVLNIFPSIDTGTCAKSVVAFNKKVATLKNCVVLGISQDLPFAQSRFCTSKKIKNVETLSAFRSSFGEDYKMTLTDSPLKGLLGRAVVVIDEKGKVAYNEVVEAIENEPNYKAALEHLK